MKRPIVLAATFLFACGVPPEASQLAGVINPCTPTGV
jgi:hypothetical protein